MEKLSGLSVERLLRNARLRRRAPQGKQISGAVHPDICEQSDRGSFSTACLLIASSLLPVIWVSSAGADWCKPPLLSLFQGVVSCKVFMISCSFFTASCRLFRISSRAAGMKPLSFFGTPTSSVSRATAGSAPTRAAVAASSV